MNINDIIFLSSETELVNGLLYYYTRLIFKKSKKDIETIDNVYNKLFKRIYWKNVRVSDLITSNAQKLVTLEMMTENKVTNRIYIDKELLEYFSKEHLKYGDCLILYKLFDEENENSLSIEEIKSIQNFRFKSLINSIRDEKIRKESENACILYL